MPRGNAKLHLVHDKGGQVFKIVDLILANGVRLLIDHAQSSQSEPVAGGQRNARIEAQAEFTGNKRIGKGAWIDRCILQYVWIGRQDRGRAQAGLTIDLLNRPTMVRFERSEEHTSELQSLMRISYAVCCLKKKTTQHRHKC